MSLYDVSVYWKDQLVCEIQVSGKTVMFKNYTTDTRLLPFGVKSTATIEDLEDYYRERSFPEERENCTEVLHSIGLDVYEPEQICRKTHGRQFDDFIWMNFSDDVGARWEEIKLRD